MSNEIRLVFRDLDAVMLYSRTCIVDQTEQVQGQPNRNVSCYIFIFKIFRWNVYVASFYFFSHVIPPIFQEVTVDKYCVYTEVSREVILNGPGFF